MSMQSKAEKRKFSRLRQSLVQLADDRVSYDLVMEVERAFRNPKEFRSFIPTGAANEPGQRGHAKRQKIHAAPSSIRARPQR